LSTSLRRLFLLLLLFPVSALAQSVAILSPSEGDLIQHSGGFGSIAVSVTATGVPPGGGVELVLDSGTSAQRSARILAPPYNWVFDHVPLGEHALDAYVIDAAGKRLPAHDRKQRIGMGDILVAVGDSITAGEVDDITSDDWSADGRDGPSQEGFGGYEPILNNMLTSLAGYPHSVPNEGLAGETSAGAKSRIAGIIARHPTAGTWLVAYGTNDAPTLMTAGTFQGNLQNIIGQIQSAIPGAVVFLPRVLYNDEARKGNYLIAQYDGVMDELSRTMPNVLRGADLDTLFHANHQRYDHKLAKPGTWLATTTTHHPNGIGFQKYAMLWKTALVDRAILVTDGAFGTLGDLGTDKASVAGVNAIGLSGSNLLEICDASQVGAPPQGTSFVGDWRVLLSLTGASGFGGGSADVTLVVETEGSLPPQVSWKKVYLAQNGGILATAKQQDSGDSSILYCTARVYGPGRIAPVLVLSMPAPTTALSVSPSKADGLNGWYLKAPRITMLATDVFGGPADRIVYRWDGGGESTYRSPIYAPSGKHSLIYYSVDSGDNAESWKSRILKVDATPPTKPIVTVSARTVKKGSAVTVSWSGRDSESGIDKFRYAIGTGTGRSNVRNWTPIGVQTSLTWKPTGAAGSVYYFSVDARNRAGFGGEVGISPSITVVP